MRKLLIGLGLFASMAYVAMISAIVTYNATDPVSRVSQVQGAILGEYMEKYCRRIHLTDRDAITAELGGMAAISRIVIKTGLGPLALAEYAKCKFATARQ
jgi:hypothetical protein